MLSLLENRLLRSFGLFGRLDQVVSFPEQPVKLLVDDPLLNRPVDSSSAARLHSDVASRRCVSSPYSCILLLPGLALDRQPVAKQTTLGCLQLEVAPSSPVSRFERFITCRQVIVSSCCASLPLTQMLCLARELTGFPSNPCRCLCSVCPGSSE